MKSCFTSKNTKRTQKLFGPNASLFLSRRRGAKMANFLLDKQGKINQARLKELLANPPRQDPLLEGEAQTHKHIYDQLKLLSTNTRLQRQINSLRLGVVSEWSLTLIRLSCFLPEKAPIGTREVRWAILSAQLTPMRQIVGSCFATALAIWVQSEHPELFIDDLTELLCHSRLSRTHHGESFRAPISFSIGPTQLGQELLSPKLLVDRAMSKWIQKRVGQNPEQFGLSLAHHPLLKVWEYTLASFMDNRSQFSKWHFAKALGLDSSDKGGIGGAIYQAVKNRHEENQHEINQLHEELTSLNMAYEVAAAQYRRGGDYHSLERAKREMQTKGAMIYQVETIRDEKVEETNFLAEFCPLLMEKLELFFPEYFQEIYDPNLQVEDPAQPLYHDQVAGFVLVYKFGRQEPTLWQPIRDDQTYIQHLTAFFHAIKQFLPGQFEQKFAETLITKTLHAIIEHIQTPEFLKASYARIQSHHQSTHARPYQHLSGGSLAQLISLYFHRSPFTQESFQYANSQELITTLIETLKDKTPPYKSLLCTNTYHAFRILLDHPSFKRAYESPQFTYTWIRDKLITPASIFTSSLTIQRTDLQLLLPHLTLDLPPTLNHQELLETLAPHLTPPQIDTFIRETFPLFQRDTAFSHLDQIALLCQVPNNLTFDALLCPVKQFYTLACTLYNASSLPFSDFFSYLTSHALLPPRGLPFADTNWPEQVFSIIPSPTTSQLTLWRTDPLALFGQPLPWETMGELEWFV